MTREREAELRRVAARLGHRFSDLGLLNRALTHSSRAHEQPGARQAHNEPLEFLGDAVLGFLVAELLHRRDPDAPEGKKTKARAAMVSAATLARHANALELPAALLLGRGEERTGGRKKATLWADAYEAVVAALYLDGGIEAARRFVLSDFAALLEPGCEPPQADFKSALQERLQARGQAVPEYVVVEEGGPAHRKRYLVECRIDGVAAGRGEGHSKKEAAHAAARRAFAVLERRGDA